MVHRRDACPCPRLPTARPLDRDHRRAGFATPPGSARIVVDAFDAADRDAVRLSSGEFVDLPVGIEHPMPPTRTAPGGAGTPPGQRSGANTPDNPTNLRGWSALTRTADRGSGDRRQPATFTLSGGNLSAARTGDRAEPTARFTTTGAGGWTSRRTAGSKCTDQSANTQALPLPTLSVTLGVRGGSRAEWASLAQTANPTGAGTAGPSPRAAADRSATPAAGPRDVRPPLPTSANTSLRQAHNSVDGSPLC